MITYSSIESLSAYISSGGTPSRKKSEYYSKDSSGHLWVKSKELLDSAIKETEELITEEGLKHSSAKYFPVDTILIAMYGANVGQLGWLKVPSTVNQAICGIIVDKQKASPRYVYYALLLTRAALAAKAQGAAQQNLNQGLIKEFQIPIQSLDIQQIIGSILTNYDDLIENNARRIQILEEITQRIYREWFVHYRFPGHEDVRMVDSGTEFGEIPEGWEITPLSKLVDTQYGYTESAQEKPVGPKYLRGMDINKSSYIDWNLVPYCPIPSDLVDRYRLKKGDIVVIRMADPGKVGIVEKEINGIFASYLVRLSIKSDKILPYYLFYFLLDSKYQGYISGASTGTTRKSASAGVLTGIDIVCPPKDIVYLFDTHIQEIRSLLNNLIDQNKNLLITRDILIPKLISGELDVSDLDIDMN